MEELLDIYTRDWKYFGVKEKSICHSKNEVLVQKRAHSKKMQPDK